MSSTPYTLRAARHGRGPAAWAAALVPAAVIVVVIAASSGAWRLVNLTLGLVGFALALVVQHEWLRRAVLEADGRTLTFRAVWRPRVLSTASAPARVVSLAVDWYGRPHECQLWIGESDSLLIRERDWDVAQLRALPHRVGLTVERDPEVLRLSAVAKKYRGALPWYAEHPILAAWIFMAVVVAVTIAFAV